MCGVPAYSQILALLSARPSADGHAYHAKCPNTANHSREDRNPSLRLWVADDGSLRCHCYKGCKWADIARALGTEPQDWFPPDERHTRRRRRRPMADIVAEYDYRDEDGNPLYQRVRLEPKSFRLRRPGPGGRGWAWSLSEGSYLRQPDGDWRQVQKGTFGATELPRVFPVLYRLPELRQADPKMPVFFVEGEKDCDLLRSLGFVATTCGSATTFEPVMLYPWLVSRRVVVMADTDPDGFRLAEKVVGALIRKHARSVRLIDEYPPADANDVSDWLETVEPERRKEEVIRWVKGYVEWGCTCESCQPKQKGRAAA